MLLSERIGEAHKKTSGAEQLTSKFEAHLQSLTPKWWSDLDEHYKEAAERVHRDTKRRQISKFTRLTAQQTRTLTLDRSGLVINRISRQLTPIEEEVLALGLSFAITPSRIPYEEIVAATEALAHRIDQQTADTLRLKIGGVLQNAKPQGPTFHPVNAKPLWTCAKTTTSSLC